MGSNIERPTRQLSGLAAQSAVGKQIGRPGAPGAGVQRQTRHIAAGRYRSGRGTGNRVDAGVGRRGRRLDRCHVPGDGGVGGLELMDVLSKLWGRMRQS